MQPFILILLIIFAVSVGAYFIWQILSDDADK